MHANEVDIDTLLVKQLLSAQFPKWAKLPVTPVQSAGTDNAIYRLGTEKISADHVLSAIIKNFPLPLLEC